MVKLLKSAASPFTNEQNMIGDQVKVLCGTPEFVAPEVVNYDFISTGSGKIFNQVNTENSYHICFALLRSYVSEIGQEYIL